MAICHGSARAFGVGSVSQAEDCFTHRHLCEFPGFDVDVEIGIKGHYLEVISIVEQLLMEMFDCLNNTSLEGFEAINKQYPSKKLKYQCKTLGLNFEKGVQLLQEVYAEIDPYGYLTLESERLCGQPVLEKYGIDFCILRQYPLAVRLFWAMLCRDYPKYNNALLVFSYGVRQIDLGQACGTELKMLSTNNYARSWELWGR